MERVKEKMTGGKSTRKMRRRNRKREKKRKRLGDGGEVVGHWGDKIPAEKLEFAGERTSERKKTSSFTKKMREC